MFLANGRAGVIDLQSKEVSEQDLSEIEDVYCRSSIAAAEVLQKRLGEDSVVFGSGVLTGSLIPAACAGVAVGERVGGSRRVAPLLGFAGVELKLTGFDLIALKGRSDVPGYLWVRDGIIEFLPSEGMTSQNAWERTDRIRHDQGDQKIQVISTGPGSSARGLHSQFTVNYWGGEDKSGISHDIAAKNVLAVALRGMGELEASDPDMHFTECRALRQDLAARLGHETGLAAYHEAGRRDDFRALLHRNVACFGCLLPCRSFLKVNEDPREMRLVHQEPGYLHYDIPALEKAFSAGMSAKDTTIALIECAKAGAEPSAAISSAVIGGGPTMDSIRRVLSDAASTGGSKDHARNFERSFGNEESYLECLGLGLCPRFWDKAGFGKTNLQTCIESALGRTI